MVLIVIILYLPKLNHQNQVRLSVKDLNLKKHLKKLENSLRSMPQLIKSQIVNYLQTLTGGMFKDLILQMSTVTKVIVVLATLCPSLK